MNQDWQEKRIRRLFRELGREDERKAPGFAVVLQAALARAPGRGLRLWVVALPALAVVVALVLLVSHLTRPDPPVDFTTLQAIPLPGPDIGPHLAIEPPETPKSQVTISVARRRRQPLPAHNSSLLISQWQSPTDSLLRIPGSELLKGLPRVPDPSSGITKSLIEKQN